MRFFKTTGRSCSLVLLLSCLLLTVAAQDNRTGTIDTAPFPDDLNGSNFTYPWPIKLYRFVSQGHNLEMAFMDVPPEQLSNRHNNKYKDPKTVVLLHGKNFCSVTWEQTARVLSHAGYRVILPDQIGFCKSSKSPSYQFSLHQLALNTRNLLAALSIDHDVIVMGHSFGGMLAARFALMYPTLLSSLVLANPIGLEDWKTKGVPYISIDESTATERASDYANIRAYEQATYYVGTWKPEYDVWVRMLDQIYHGSERDAFTVDMARVVDMVLTQPVVYEFGLIRPRTLMLIGEKDNTAIGKQWSPPEVQERLGHYDVLGKEACAAIPHCTLVEFPDLGHAPQMQAPGKFHSALLQWLRG